MQLTAEERLEAIKNGLPSKDLIRSESKRLAYVMAQIEAALDEGISQPVIYAALKKGGLVLAESSFKSTLSRVRKRQRITAESADNGVESLSESPSSPAPSARDSEGEIEASVDKSDKQKYEEYQAKLEAKGFLRDHSDRSKNRK